MVRGLRIAPIDAHIDQENAVMMTLTVQKRAGPVGIHVHSVDNETRVNGVVPDSPCAEGDMRVGDVILRIDGKAVEGAIHAAHMFSSSCEGELAVTVMRTCGGSGRSSSSSGSSTDGAQARRPWSARRQRVAVSRNSIYAELITLVVRPQSTEQQPATVGLHVAEENGGTHFSFERREEDQPLKREVASLRVTSVEQGSPCESAGFAQGDIVHTVDGRTPASATELLGWLTGDAVNVVVSRTCS